MATINIILDERRCERKELLLEEFRKQNITDYKFWDCVILPNVVESINASHKMIVRDAKERGLKEVCIGEDDLMFTCKGAWNYFLKQKPPKYDVYIAGSYLINNDYNYTAPLVKVNEWVGNHLIIVSENYYDTFLSVPNNDHIDTIQKGLGDFFMCFPIPALQRPGFSSNNKCVCNYNSILPKSFIYEK